MKTNGIRILDKKNQIVCVKLQDILEEIVNGEQFYWSILFFYGTGNLRDDKSIPVFEDEVRKLERGMLIKWDALNLLAGTLDQVVDMLIIASKDLQLISRYKNDIEMYEACDIVVEMVDSSYWEVFSRDEGLVGRLAAKFKDTKFLTPDFKK